MDHRDWRLQRGPVMTDFGVSLLLPLPPLLLLEQILELLALVLDPVRQPLFARRSRLRRRLLGELAKIVAQNRDPIADLVIGKHGEVRHADVLFWPGRNLTY